MANEELPNIEIIPVQNNSNPDKTGVKLTVRPTIRLAGSNDKPTRRDPRVPSRRHKGFTLVELLVVIGIVALLISILIPALNRAKAEAERKKKSEQPVPVQPAEIDGIQRPTLVAANVWKFPVQHKSGKNVFDASLKYWLSQNTFTVVSISGQPGDSEWMTYNYVMVK